MYAAGTDIIMETVLDTATANFSTRIPPDPLSYSLPFVMPSGYLHCFMLLRLECLLAVLLLLQLSMALSLWFGFLFWTEEEGLYIMRLTATLLRTPHHSLATM